MEQRRVLAGAGYQRERAYALGAIREISAVGLPALAPTAKGLPPAEKLPTLDEVERGPILRALQPWWNNAERVARAPGISHRTFQHRMKESHPC